MPAEFSVHAKCLVKALLKKDPLHRYASKKIMLHSFFEIIEWNAVIAKKNRPPFISMVENVPFDRKRIIKKKTVFNSSSDNPTLPYLNDLIDVASIFSRHKI